VRRDFLNVRNESFADHFGFVFKEYDTWVTEREASSAHDWSLLHVAYVDGEPAAGILRTNNFVPDENCGYVLTLGTAPKYQSRGLAAAMGSAGQSLRVARPSRSRETAITSSPLDAKRAARLARPSTIPDSLLPTPSGASRSRR